MNSCSWGSGQPAGLVLIVAVLLFHGYTNAASHRDAGLAGNGLTRLNRDLDRLGTT